MCKELIDGNAVLNEYCYYYGGVGSFFIDYPKAYEYESRDCTRSIIYTLNFNSIPTCAATKSIYDDDYQFGLGTDTYQGFRQVNAPAPTRKPTFAPTAAVVSTSVFTSNIPLGGVSSTSLDTAAQ